MRGLYESLLGGIDNLTDELDSDVILNPNGELITQGQGQRDTRNFSLSRPIYKQEKSGFKNGELTLAASSYTLLSDSKPLKTFFPKLKHLLIPGKFCTDGITVSPETICDEITTGQFIYRSSFNAKQNPVSNITINIKSEWGQLNDCKGRAVGSCIFNTTGGNPKFSNVNINFDKSVSDLNKCIVFGSEYLYNLKGIQSNAKIVKFHDTFAIEDDDKVGDFAKLFDWTWVCPTYDSQKKEQVMRPIKNWKTLAATLNNPKRYRSVNKQFFIKPKKGAKLSDYFDLSGFKELETIEMWNNNIQINITKNPSKIESSMRMANKPLDFSDATWPVFEDGWYIFGS